MTLKPHNSRIAVIGSNGFIGRNLYAFLIKRNFFVLGFNSENPIVSENVLNPEILDMDVIIWCASRVNPLTAENRKDLVERDLREWNTVLDFLETSVNPRMKLIYLSSGGCTYTSEDMPFSEASEALGNNTYGKIKIAMEKELKSREISSTILRVANVYGPDQPFGRGQGVIAEWAHAIEKNLDIQVFGSLSSFRDYIFIDDVCEGIVKVASLSESTAILNLGSGVPTELGRILEIFRTMNFSNPNVQISDKRVTDRDGYYLDISKLRYLTSWSPNFSIEDGIRETIVNKDE